MMRLKKYMILSMAIILFTALSACTEQAEYTISPLGKAVMVNEPVTFELDEAGSEGIDLVWDFGDDSEATGSVVSHEYQQPGIYTVSHRVAGAQDPRESSTMIIRVHTPESLNTPQVFVDTDARNEADDQHYIAYCLYSYLDVLGINSIHNNEAGSEEINYGEIFYVLKMMNWSGTAWDSLPLDRVYHGAKRQLNIPERGKWYDTAPVITDASNAILAAARGANPANPVWIMPVGPCTNIASAVLQARAEGFELKERIRVYWLGGREKHFHNEYNGGNDPWSVYVMGESGIEFTVMLGHPTSLKLNIDKRVEAHLYPDNELGDYLETIIPVFQWKSTIPKSIHDVCVPAAIISDYKGFGWVTSVEPAKITGPENEYSWEEADSTSNVRLVWDIDGEAMKRDLFNTLNGNPTQF